MIQAKGIAAASAKAALGPFSFARRDPREFDVVIDIKYCGICHSDIHQAREEWGRAVFPMVPGHEIAGVVRSVGAKVTKFRVGDHVGVGCFVDSCRECSSCKQQLDQYCLKRVSFTYNSFEADGKTPTYGGYSDVIVVDENYVVRIPDSLPLDQAAPLLCAGITLYSPLRHWKVQSGTKVGIMGLGGLGHMGVKLAAAMGAEVTVFSHSDKKRSDALRMGAQHFVTSNDKQAFTDRAYYFDLLINTISADIDLGQYLGMLKVDATMVVVGIAEKPIPVPAHALVGKRRNYAGSMIGSIKETQEMLDFCGEHQVTSEIERITPEQVNQAYERVVKSDVRYRFVIDLGKL